MGQRDVTDDLGTLAGLIADLEGLHQPHLDPGDPWCDQEPADWPCPTIELVRKHKRAQWRIGEYAPHPTYLPSGRKVTHYVVPARDNVDLPPFSGTEAECEAWIERQVNGDA